MHFSYNGVFSTTDIFINSLHLQAIAHLAIATLAQNTKQLETVGPNAFETIVDDAFGYFNFLIVSWHEPEKEKERQQS